MHWLEYLSEYQYILAAVFLYATLGSIVFYLMFWLRLPFFKAKPGFEQLPPLTVIISARNEEDNLRTLIPEILTQDYPDFELVVVNDSSWDDTKDILDAFKIGNPNIHIIHLDEDKQRLTGKKMAITLAVKAANHDHLVFTDADCRPASQRWLREIASRFTERKEIVIGYSPYLKSPGLLNWLIRFDSDLGAVSYLNRAIAGSAYMGVGRNLAYTKALFFRSGGFRKHMSLLSGDDDLFVNQNATRRNTAVCIAPDSFVSSVPKTTWKDWTRQKERHYTTAPHYRWTHKFVLGLPSFFFVLMAFSLPAVLLSGLPAVWVWGVVGLRYLVQLVTFTANAKKLGGAYGLMLMPLVEPFYLLVTTYLYIRAGRRKRQQWN